MSSLVEIRKSKISSDHVIIFVHGFTGDKNTFRCNGNHICELLDKKIIDRCDVYEFNYYSKVIDFNALKKFMSKMGLFRTLVGAKYNTDILSYSKLLETYYADCCSKYKTVSFISHSMGGLISKQCVINIVKRYGNYNGIYISIATPHRGVSEAKVLSVLNNRFINDMEPFSTFIDGSNTEWNKIHNKIKKKYYCATHDELVNSRSACPDGDKNMDMVEGTHTTVVKPKSSKCALIRSVNNDFIQYLNLGKISKNTSECAVREDEVLFYTYKATYEKYYLIRHEDTNITKQLSCNNVWIYGPSGAGKTNLIQHYIFNSNIKYICLDMSPTDKESNVTQILSSIYWDIRNQIESKTISAPEHDENKTMIASISQLLEHYSGGDDLVLYIDELHISDNAIFCELIDILTILISYHTNKSLAKPYVKFIVTTIKEPMAGDNARFRSKFNELFNCYRIGYWTEPDMSKLFDMLRTALKLRLTDSLKSHVLKASKSSPRRLKTIIKKLISNKSVVKAIKEVDAEDVN